MSCFVTVGTANQPFTRLLDAVRQTAAQLPRPILVQHGHTPFSPWDGWDGRMFLPPDDFSRAMNAATVVICHGAAGSILHARQAGRVPVVMDRQAGLGEHVDDHQEQLCAALDREGVVVWARSPHTLAAAVEKAMALQASAPGLPPARQLTEAVAAAIQHEAARRGKRA